LRTPDSDLLAVGSIAKAFGIKGEVVVDPMTDSPSRFRTLKRVLIGERNGTVRRCVVERVWVERRGVRAKLSGVNSRTEAEHLVGALLYVEPQARVRLPRGRHFVHELVGLRVLDQDGRLIGIVKDVMKLPAQDVYVVNRNGREVLLPAVKEFVLGVDPDAGTISMKVIEGMLEEQ